MAKENKDYIAQMQGGRSFVKAKMDSAGIGKVHLSFVEHSGKPKCEQLASIESYINFDGTGSVSQLYFLVMSGALRRLYGQSIKRAKETGSKYPDAIWEYSGGSAEKRDSNGNVTKPCRFYAVKVSPGSKSEIVMQVAEGEGEVTETGGFMLKKGATLKRINVPFTYIDFCAFVVTIHDSVSAYMVSRASSGVTGTEVNEFTPYKLRNGSAAAPSATPVQTPPAQTAPAQTHPAQAAVAPAPSSDIAAPAAPTVVYVMYDSLGKTFQAADSADTVVRMLRSLAIALDKNTPEHYKVNSQRMWEATKNAVYSGAPDIPVVGFTSEDRTKTCSVAIRRVEVKRYA